jgi:hypothetical protein
MNDGNTDIEFGGWGYGYSKIINAWGIFRIFVKMPTSLLCEHEIVEWGLRYTPVSKCLHGLHNPFS